MGLNNCSADDVINKLGQKELSKIFKILGEEKNSNIISKKIILLRKSKKVQTEDLVEIINSVKKKNSQKLTMQLKFFKELEL